jgi:hypothetical protein
MACSTLHTLFNDVDISHISLRICQRFATSIDLARIQSVSFASVVIGYQVSHESFLSHLGASSALSSKFDLLLRSIMNGTSMSILVNTVLWFCAVSWLSVRCSRMLPYCFRLYLDSYQRYGFNLFDSTHVTNASVCSMD